jgi:hypothetical protein
MLRNKATAAAEMTLLSRKRLEIRRSTKQRSEDYRHEAESRSQHRASGCMEDIC